MVRLAKLHKSSHKTLLPFPNYSIAIIALEELKNKLCVIIDFRKMIGLVLDVYRKFHQPVSTSDDTAQHLEHSNYLLFYQCLHIIEEKPNEMLSFHTLRTLFKLVLSLFSFRQRFRYTVKRAINVLHMGSFSELQEKRVSEDIMRAVVELSVHECIFGVNRTDSCSKLENEQTH